jgi:hypothetical protein
VRRLNSANWQQFPFLLRSFMHHLNENPILAAVRDELLARTSADKPEDSVNRILAGEALHGTTEQESAAIGYLLLVRFADKADQKLV